MAKKIIFESAIHQLASAARRLCSSLDERSLAQDIQGFCKSWQFTHLGGTKLKVAWSNPSPGEVTVNLKEAKFYQRGDEERFKHTQVESSQLFSPDKAQSENQALFDDVLLGLLEKAGVSLPANFRGTQQQSRFS